MPATADVVFDSLGMASGMVPSSVDARWAQAILVVNQNPGPKILKQNYEKYLEFMEK